MWGKRTKASTGDDDEVENVVETAKENLMTTLNLLGASGDVEFQQVVTSIHQHAVKTENDKYNFKKELVKFPRDCLQRLNLVNGPKDKNLRHKLITLKSIIFADALKLFRTKANKVKLAEKAMEEVIAYMLASCYGNDEGQIQWSNIRVQCEDQISVLDKAAGVQDFKQHEMALAQQRVEAEAMAQQMRMSEQAMYAELRARVEAEVMAEMGVRSEAEQVLTPKITPIYLHTEKPCKNWG